MQTATQLALVLSLGLTAPAAAGAASKPPGSKDAKPTANDVLVGRIFLLEKSLRSAESQLDAGNARKLLKSGKQLVQCYGSVATGFHSAFQSAGYALAKIDLARNALKRLQADVDPRADAAELKDLVACVAVLRDRTLKDLADLRRRYADAKTPKEAAALLPALASRASQVERLDRTINIAHTREAQALAKLKFTRPIDLLEKEVRAEMQLLDAQSRSLTVLVRQAVRQIDVAMRYLQISANLPREKLQDLRNTQTSLRTLRKSIQQNRRKSLQSVTDATGQGVDGRPVDDKDVIDRVNRLLRPAPKPSSKTGG